MTIALHLGVHKTGSTYLQAALQSCAPALAEAGVGVVPFETLRAEFTARAWARPDRDAARNSENRQAAAAWLRGVLAGRPARLVLSDENLLGTPDEIVATGRLYPRLEARLGPMAEMLRGERVELYLGLRHPAEFSRSVFCENLRAPQREFTPAEAFRERWLAGDTSWQPVVARIRALFPDAPVVLWNFKTFREDPDRVIAAVAGVERLPDYEVAPWDRRQGLSQAATETLLEIGARDGARAMAAQSHEIAKAHPLAESNWLYELWSADETPAFQEQFSRDLRRLSRQPGVTLIRPGG